MAGFAFQLPGGSYRRADFFFCLPPGMNQQFVLNAALVFKEEVREFCHLGRKNMLPTGFFSGNQNRHHAVPTEVFYFKKFPSAANQLRIVPRDLAFFTRCRSSKYATHWAANFWEERLPYTTSGKFICE